MAGVEFHARVRSRPDLAVTLDAEVEVVAKDADPCPLCEANNDPARVPVHRGCNCRRVLVNISRHLQ